jgi:hypothetical protein
VIVTLLNLEDLNTPKTSLINNKKGNFYEFFKPNLGNLSHIKPSKTQTKHLNTVTTAQRYYYTLVTKNKVK